MCIPHLQSRVQVPIEGLPSHMICTSWQDSSSSQTNIQIRAVGLSTFKGRTFCLRIALYLVRLPQTPPATPRDANYRSDVPIRSGAIHPPPFCIHLRRCIDCAWYNIYDLDRRENLTPQLRCWVAGSPVRRKQFPREHIF